MESARSPYPIVVLGRVAVEHPGRVRTLSAAKQRTLAVLVARGTAGVDLDAFQGGEHPGPGSLDSLRVSMSRLRLVLPDGVLPEAAAGRYRLQAAVDDVDVWHLEALATGAIPLDLPPERLRHLLRPAEPYAPFSDQPAVRAAAQLTRRHQLLLLDRFVTDRPDALRGDLVDHLVAHLDDDPYNERLVLLCAGALAARGDRRQALDVLARATRELARFGLGVSADLASFERALLDGRVPVGANLPTLGPAQPRLAPLPPLPRTLADQLEGPFVGRRTDLDGLLAALGDDGPGVVTIDGRSGVGKTRACAEVARTVRARAVPVVYAAPLAEGGAALGPFVDVLPGLADRVAAAFERHDDVESRRAASRVAAADALGRVAGPGPLLLVVDDCQWLDSYSADFLLHLAARRTPGLTVILAGRADGADGASWHRLVAAVQRLGAHAVAVEPFDVEAVAELVRTRRPDLAEPQVRRLAPELLAQSGGLPGVAAPLLDALDDATLTLPSAHGLRPSRALEAAVDQLDEDARTVGVVGSIVGPVFDLATVGEVAGLPVDRVLAGLDRLVRRALVVERSLTEFALSHVLVQAAFLEGTARARLAEWHRRAAHRFRDDVHRYARHLAEAVPLVPAVDAATALRDAASASLAAGRPRAAVAAFRQAEELAGPLAPVDGGAYARALDLSGLHELARGVRRQAFEAAMGLGDGPTALRVATSGLPEAEPIDGDLTIVEHLDRLAPVALPDAADRWLLAYQQARQLAIAGRIDDAVRAADRLPALAATGRDRLDAAVVRRFVVSATTTPDRRLGLLTDGAPELGAVDADRRAGFLVVQAIDLYEAGRVDEALAAFGAIDGLLDDLPPWRRWHTMLFAAMVATDRGAVQADRRARRQAAFDHAVAHGLGEAHNGLLVAEFVDLWLRDRTASLRGAVDGGMIDPERSVLLRAGAAVILAASGDEAQGLVHAHAVVRSVLASPVSQGVAAVALVSDVLGRVGDPDLVAAARALLEQRGDSMVIVGAGAACVGPVARYQAALTTDPAERLRLLRSARALADRSGLRLWQVVARRDLLGLTHAGPGRADRADLADLVAGTDLGELLATEI